MNTVSLIAAIAYLAVHNKHMATEYAILAIEFEDGSGKKFNYKDNVNKDWKFIDLTGKI